jgi:hypothetical protein
MLHEPDTHKKIAEAAYLIAQRRGFTPDHELADWIAAEKAMATESDSVDRWELYHYSDGRWTWRNVCPGGSQLSDQAFDNWVEAMADAISKGFEAGESDLVERESRRAQPRHNP